MADNVVTALTDYGCDTKTALNRFMGNEGLYIKFLGKFLEDPSFNESEANIAAGDHEASLKSVHTLKGVAGNLGLTPLYDIAADMVNKYREPNPDAADARFPELAAVYRDIVALIK